MQTTIEAIPIKLGRVSCCICDEAADGSLYRPSPYHSRIYAIITDPIIPRVDGVIALCHNCQCYSAKSKGFLRYLTCVLTTEACRRLPPSPTKGERDRARRAALRQLAAFTEGETTKGRKISEEAVREIRERYSAGEGLNELASRFQCNPSYVWLIATGKRRIKAAMQEKAE